VLYNSNVLDRYGYLEEAFMTFSFSPVRDESGEVGGIFHPITETTALVLNARRTQSLRDLSAAIDSARTVDDIGCQLSAHRCAWTNWRRVSVTCRAAPMNSRPGPRWYCR
jgi:hypothetical protein